MPRRPRRHLTVLCLGVLLVASGCSVGPSHRPAVAVPGDAPQQVRPHPQPPRPDPVPSLGPPASDTLSWENCTDRTREEVREPAAETMRFSCAHMLTTVDSPDGTATGIAETALARAGRGDVPLVVLNDVRGEPGTIAAARLASRMPAELLDRYSIIGLDRRGTARSDGADCIPPRQRERVIGFDPLASERAQLDDLFASLRDASQQCLLKLDEQLPAYNTVQTAKDLEDLRNELGVPKLHVLARGEGSRVATTYAAQHPDSVGRTVLDGAVDPQRDAVGRAESAARTAENTFDVFARECSYNPDCPLGRDPRKTVRELVERTRVEPLPAPQHEVRGGHVIRAVRAGLADRTTWPGLARALANAVDGDGTALAAMTDSLAVDSEVTPPRLDGELITWCNDTAERVPPERVARLAADWVDRFPLFGGVTAQRLAWCAQWPAPQDIPSPPDGRDLPPVPVISTVNDPWLGQLGSERAARRLPSATLLRWQGAGRGAVGRSDCVTGAVSRFLVDATPPPEDLVCPE